MELQTVSFDYNIPLKLKEQTAGEDACPCKPNNDPMMVIEKHARDSWLDNIGIRASQLAKFPQFASVQARAKSFSACTRQLKVKPLSEAGFFYHGKEDCTICFHCGGGLKEWKESDDPWIEHAYWYPRCNYVLTAKGKAFVEQSWGRKKEAYSPEEMHKAETLKNLLDMFKCKKPLPTPVQSGTNSNKPLKDSPTVCRICFVEERNVMFVPCRHIIACDNCAANLTSCVICRNPIEDAIRVFLS